jgi:LPXTG-site transpeptidase (sortase) family protein
MARSRATEWPGRRGELADLCRELGELVAALDLGSPPVRRRRRRRSARLVRRLVLVVGLVLVVAGIVVLLVPLLGLWQRSRVDESALSQWQHGGSAIVAGPAPASSQPTATCGTAASPADAYALVSFPSLSRWGYRAVAGDGTWDLLRTRSMVHYQTSAAPGQAGNVIIAFHREPSFEHIDELRPGDIVDVQDRSCTVFHYRVTQMWTVDPDKVSQLVPTRGHDLTLVTCTPWFRDTQRIVWRATLVGASTPTPTATVSAP